MKRISVIIILLLLYSGSLYSQEDIYDAFKGSFGMYDAAVEMIVLDKIESQTDPETEKVKIGGLTLKFEYFANALDEVDGLQVAAVHFSDKDDKYILDYYVDGSNVVKILLFTKNGEVVNKELYSAKSESKTEEKEKSK